MKTQIIKSFAVLTIILCTFSMESCSKVENNPLVGTKWTANYADHNIMVLEFISDSEVQGYFAKQDGTYDSGKTFGTYNISCSEVTFYDITFKWLYAYYKLETGSVKGSLLSTDGKKTFNIENNEWKTWTETWNKY